MAYTYGSSHQQATEALRALHHNIRQSEARLDAVRWEIAEAKRDLARTLKRAERERINMEARAAATARDVLHLLDNANEAEKAYAAAIKAHPEDVLEGPRRLRLLDREVMATQKHRLKAVS